MTLTVEFITGSDVAASQILAAALLGTVLLVRHVCCLLSRREPDENSATATTARLGE